MIMRLLIEFVLLISWSIFHFILCDLRMGFNCFGNWRTSCHQKHQGALTTQFYRLAFSLVILIPLHLQAQLLQLNSLQSFQPQKGNWSEASKVTGNPFVKHQLTVTSGAGILVNQNTAEKNSHLVSLEEHGDADVELEFMMAPGSNSGVYLMGRYEIQLLDSWGVKDPKFSDCGGIYQRWNQATSTGYDGIPPLANACKAPGLWQKLQLSFTAPRFDASGKKIANANVSKVYLNGFPIHRYAEFTGPTRGAMFASEATSGPLLIQGDHGPLAIRNLKLTRYTGSAPTLSNITFEAYEGNYWNLPPFPPDKLKKSGKADGINVKLAESSNDFGIRFKGTMQIPQAGKYAFTSKSNGQTQLKIDGVTVLDTPAGMRNYNAWTPYTASVQLTQGNHSFELVHSKTNVRNAPALGLFVSAEGLRELPLHEPSSLKFGISSPGIDLHAGKDVRMQRGFVEHRGVKKSYSVAVSEPNGANYFYNLETGALLSVWSGSFVDVTTMWRDRGDRQTMYANNARQDFADVPAFVTGMATTWPDSLPTNKLVYRGYKLDADQRPTYQFTLSGATIDDKITANSPKELTRMLRWKKDSGTDLSILLTKFETMEPIAPDLFLVNQQWYLKTKPMKPGTGKIEKSGDHWRFVPAENEGTFEYSIIW